MSKDNSDKLISSEELFDMNNINISDATPFGKSCFCHYTTIANLDKILFTGKIWASKITATNDLSEGERYRESGKDKFILCFCSSKRENIPMWYLYSGINGDGGRLQLTGAKMKKFIASISKVHPVYNGKIQENVTLKINEDFTLSYGWVYYMKGDTEDKEIKYRNRTYHLSGDSSRFYDNNFYVKEHEWNYEKEFRLIITMINQNIECDRVAIDIDVKNISITLAPEFKNKEILLSYKGFREYLKSKVFDSHLRISMNLIKKGVGEMTEYMHKLDLDDLERIKEGVEAAIQKKRVKNEY